MIVIDLWPRAPDQARVSTGLLPVVTTAHETTSYVDCSKVGSVHYDDHQPCQTFVLLHSSHFGSVEIFLNAEQGQLRRAGWRHPRAPLLVDSDAGNHTASTGESWAAPNHKGCAFITTGAAGVSAEAKEILRGGFDPYNTPQGVLDFYRTAESSRASQTLWARLEPAYIRGQARC